MFLLLRGISGRAPSVVRLGPARLRGGLVYSLGFRVLCLGPLSFPPLPAGWLSGGRVGAPRVLRFPGFFGPGTVSGAALHAWLCACCPGFSAGRRHWCGFACVAVFFFSANAASYRVRPVHWGSFQLVRRQGIRSRFLARHCIRGRVGVSTGHWLATQGVKNCYSRGFRI